ncbi:hypothetical protein [Neptuniibacter sp. QD37_11]|uniref:hypothetical protein n=1 Tax=Neptuniibacter sp. QD37_11 TaxID=3398209 RepID=UPI0039F4EA77
MQSKGGIFFFVSERYAQKESVACFATDNVLLAMSDVLMKVYHPLKFSIKKEFGLTRWEVEFVEPSSLGDPVFSVLARQVSEKYNGCIIREIELETLLTDQTLDELNKGANVVAAYNTAQYRMGRDKLLSRMREWCTDSREGSINIDVAQVLLLSAIRDENHEFWKQRIRGKTRTLEYNMT